MKIVLDTNVIFSAILNTEGTIASLLLTENSTFQFYSLNYVFSELYKHQAKLLKILKLESRMLLDELKSMITQNIRFISEYQINNMNWRTAHNLTADIDHDNIAFVALAYHLNAKLWTGTRN